MPLLKEKKNKNHNEFLFNKKNYGDRVMIFCNVGKILEIKEHSQIYLHLHLFKDTSRARTSESLNSKFHILQLY